MNIDEKEMKFHYVIRYANFFINKTLTPEREKCAVARIEIHLTRLIPQRKNYVIKTRTMYNLTYIAQRSHCASGNVYPFFLDY